MLHERFGNLALAAFVIFGLGACDNGDTRPPQFTPTPLATASPTITPTAAVSATPTVPPTETPTDTPSPAPTASPTPTVVVTAGDLKIVSPDVDVAVATFSFPLEIELPERGVDLDSLAVTINGAHVDLDDLGNGRLGTTLQPGPPLLDTNRLEISVRTAVGGTVSRTAEFVYGPPKARVVRITSADQLIEGPLAQGQVGDFLLENAVARFIVQDVAERGLSNVGTFGGNLIDAELLSDPGRDEFLEVQPLVNIESVINAQTVEILNDGQDGTAASIVTCGPDDLLDFVNISANLEEAIGVQLPGTIDDQDYEVEGCTEYRLEPEVARVRMETTIFNQGDVEIGLFVGDIMAAGGGLDPWAVRPNGRGGIGEVLLSTANGISFIGQRAASGLAYSYVPAPTDGGTPITSEVVGVGGVTVALHDVSIATALATGVSPFRIPVGGSNSYVRYFGVGQGGGEVAVGDIIELNGLDHGTLAGCVSVAGVAAPGARVAVGPGSGGVVRGLSSHFVTDSDGCFEGRLRPGNYAVAAFAYGAPFAMDGNVPTGEDVVVEVAQSSSVLLDLPGTAQLTVNVRDEAGRPMPARVSLLGFDESVEPGLRTPSLAGEATTWLFDDYGNDRLPFGIAAFAYADSNGVAEMTLEPGEYYVAVSRGTEYSLFQAPVSFVAGDAMTIDAQIARVLDTRGFVSSDFHVHGINSTDSRVSRVDRTLQYAGEGVENIVMTEHGGRTDLSPTIADLGLTSFIRSTIGEEITGWQYGHFNGYPFDLVVEHQSGGAVDWAKAAPPGRDFPSFGAFIATPAELEEIAMTGPGARPSTVLQINHVGSYFGPLRIDTSLVPPQSFATEAIKRGMRLDPSAGNLFHHFPAMELWNGGGEGAQSGFLNGVIGIWFNLLNQGLFVAGTGVTDSHKFTNLGAAGTRSWTASSTDDPAAIDPDEVAEQVRAGRVVLGQGAFLEARLVAADGSEGIADLGSDGSTIVETTNGAVDLEIRAQSPMWAGIDRIEVYRNAQTVATGQSGDVDTSFGAEPTLVLRSGDDFAVEAIDVYPEIAGAQRQEINLTVPFSDLTEDSWFVVVARGTRNDSLPMFPVMPHDLRASQNETLAALAERTRGEHGVRAMAVTNALFADVDGEPGFQAPLAPDGAE